MTYLRKWKKDHGVFYTYNFLRAVRFENTPTGKIDNLLEESALEANITFKNFERIVFFVRLVKITEEDFING